MTDLDLTTVPAEEVRKGDELEVGEHTCGGYGPESNYMHEPGCGFEPILDLSKMEGWPGDERDALAATVERVRVLARYWLMSPALRRATAARELFRTLDGTEADHA